ncbi:fungal specific transcription factor domain-containing protein [Zalerion maritima]|uniref:Fungal specific transcription factor domain-containing protein n=1 Tax=Zalerion maritima TaxID=339359 RepID=A0AAD5RXG1_9PEZI|nr:fungal specific transcription factor domain-containing protein [Zalerion maritima]
MQNRIDRLESLVLSLMHGGATVSQPVSKGFASTESPNTNSSSARADLDHNVDTGVENTPEDGDSDTDDLATSLGVLKVDYDRGKSMYVGQQHWHTILSDIAEVKHYFVQHKKDLEQSYEKVLSSKPSTARDGPTFLLGAVPASDIELRAELPPKSSVLTLCGRYFNSMDNAVNIIHAPTFHQQLHTHWQEPSKTPIMWLGLLYSILCLAMLSYHTVGNEPSEWRGRTLELAAEYRLRTVQCLVTADYTKPTDYTVETMVLYLFGEHSSRWDVEFGLWLISSFITRIAFRMGYHRDAKWFSTITPFQAEMRRRTWSMVRMCDIMFSHLVSLPTMISDDDCDVQLPSNIFDEEFGPDTKVLPPSRPLSEATPVSYMIAKTKLATALGTILQAISKVGKSVPYDDILRYDANLRELKAELPPHLRIQPLDESRDPVTLLIARYNIDILYQKIICLLHRKYLPRARFNPRYAHSRRRAIEASLETLRHLSTLNKESQPNGRLRSLRWHVNLIATKDFLLPAMIIAVDLHFDSQMRRSATPDVAFFWSQSQTAEMTSHLETTRDIWRGLSDQSIEAVKAFNILNIMLQKIRAPVQNQGLVGPTMQIGDYGPDELHPEQSAAMTLGMLSSGVTPSPNSMGGGVSGAGGFGMNSPSEGGTSIFAESGRDPSGIFSGTTLGAVSGATEGLMADLDTGGFGTAAGMSPTSMFNNLTSSMDLTANFDWDTVANYAQSANWGSDQNFQFFSGSADQAQTDSVNEQFYPPVKTPPQQQKQKPPST